MNKSLWKYTPIITMFPAIVMGTITMYLNDVTVSIYIQNIIYLIVLSLCNIFLLKRKKFFNHLNPMIWVIMCIVAMLLTFIDSGIEGVHRWSAIGPIRLYMSVIVLPVFFINVWRLLEKEKRILSTIAIISVSILLTLQPDASVMTAFFVTCALLLWNKIKNIYWLLLTTFLTSLTVFTWIFLDELKPVEYVEGIFQLISDRGPIWSIFGVISLAIMVIPFFMFSLDVNKRLSVCFGMYFVTILITTIFGNFPIPLMGYGISPIIGYYISIIWFTRAKLYNSY